VTENTFSVENAKRHSLTNQMYLELFTNYNCFCALNKKTVFWLLFKTPTRRADPYLCIQSLSACKSRFQSL